MGDLVEAGCDVALQHPFIGLGCQEARLGHGVMRAPVGPEAVRARHEVRLEDRLQHQLQGRLHHAVGDGRDAQPPTLARPRLGDHPFPHRQRAGAAGLQLLPHLGEEVLHPEVFPDEGGGPPVDSGRACALVPRDPFPGHQQKAGIGDEVIQIVEPAMRIVVRPTVQLGLDLQYPPLSPQRAERQLTRIHQRPPGIPVLPPLTCWLPSPCDRLSRPRTTTEPPPRPMPSADDVPARPPRWLRGARATPDGSHVHLKVDRRVRRPALPLRHRHGYAADIHRGLPVTEHIATKEFPAARRRQLRAATSPYPPDLSWWAVKGRQSLVPLVRLPVSLAEPRPSGDADPSRRCQGCSRPHRRLPDQAALSFTRPLRRPGGRGLSPQLDFRRLVAHMAFRPVDPAGDLFHPSSNIGCGESVRGTRVLISGLCGPTSHQPFVTPAGRRALALAWQSSGAHGHGENWPLRSTRNTNHHGSVATTSSTTACRPRQSRRRVQPQGGLRHPPTPTGHPQRPPIQRY